MNKHRCPVCNKFMYRDEVETMESGVVVFKCPDGCKEKIKHKFQEIVREDEEATIKMWQEINIQNNLPKNFGLNSS